jgi:hypothetical protein
MGPTTGPNTAPTPHNTIAVGCKCFGKVDNIIACPNGIIGAPNIPCPILNKIKLSRFIANPHKSEDMVNPKIVNNINFCHPSRLANQPVRGVATAAATRFNVITHETSSWLADIAPRIWGKTTFAIVIVMPKSILDN